MFFLFPKVSRKYDNDRASLIIIKKNNKKITV